MLTVRSWPCLSSLVLLWFHTIIAVHAGRVWPKPHNQTFTARTLCIDVKRFHFKITGFKSGVLKRALQRNEGYIFDTPTYLPTTPETVTRVSQIEGCIKRLEVEVGISDQSLNDAVDESYVLRVDFPVSFIQSRTVFGALHALETFSQMVDRVNFRDLDDHDRRKYRQFFTSTWLDRNLPDEPWFDRNDDTYDATSEERDDDTAAATRKLLQLPIPEGCLDRTDLESCPEAPDTWPLMDEVMSRHRRHRSTLYLINASIIWDGPRFKHRGLLLDTSRHFLSVETILDHLDAMAWTKMNVLHWHMVDDQSFPYGSDIFPELSEAGAYSWRHVYERADIAWVVAYAKDRGIRVIPEFDTPGHTASWGRSFGDLLTTCYQDGKPTSEKGPLNPVNERVYGVLWSLLREVGQRFPDEYVHLGGDEVPFDCWQSNPEVQAWMSAHNMSDYRELEGYYIDRVMRLALAAGKSPIVWQEVFDNDVELNTQTVVHVWKWWTDAAAEQARAASNSAWDEQQWRLQQAALGDDVAWKNELERITQQGYRAVLSSPWYLNLGQYVGGNNSDWKRYYQVEPLDFQGGHETKVLVMGGEACAWGEYIDGTNSLDMIWPRAAAVAERLWAASDIRDMAEAEMRLTQHRCRMVARGLRAQPLGPGFCPGDELL